MDITITHKEESVRDDVVENMPMKVFEQEQAAASQGLPDQAPGDTKLPAMYRGNLGNTGVYQTRAARVFADEPNWIFRAGALSYTAPVVCGCAVFAGLGRSLYALDIASGIPKWVYDAGTEIYHSPAVGQGVVVLTDSSRKSLIALDFGSGQPVPMNLGRNDYFWSPPKIVGNLVMVGGWNSVHAVSLSETSSLDPAAWTVNVGAAFFPARRSQMVLHTSLPSEGRYLVGT